MSPFTDYVLDRFLAPHVSEFTRAEIPDASSRARRWLDGHLVNSVLRAAFREELRPFIFNVLRRVEGAFRAHSAARQLTQRFLEGSRQSVSEYMDALLEWEAFLAQASLAYAVLRRAFATDVFRKGDGSVEERLNCLYNASKHAEKWITRGELPPNGTVVVWMSNAGLQSIDHALSWAETDATLRDLGDLADAFEDPQTTEERLRNVVATRRQTKSGGGSDA